MAQGQKRIFLSHASKDKVLADKLVDLLTSGCAVNPNDILCTTLDGKGIPVGSGSFIEFLRNQIQKPELVILLISENFFASHFCVCELGAVWGMNLPNFPLVVPPTDKGKLKAVLLGAQVGEINRPSSLDELRDTIKETLGTEVPTATWSVKSELFLSGINAVIASLEAPKVVSAEAFKAAEERYKAAMGEAAEKELEIRKLRTQIAELEKCKDKAEVQRIKGKFSTEEEEFEELVSQARNALGKLNRATRIAIFYSYRGDHYSGAGDWEDVQEAERRQELFITHEFSTSCSVNSEHIKVSKAEATLGEIGSFLNDDAHRQFVAGLEEEHEFPINLKNKEFWTTILQVYV